MKLSRLLPAATLGLLSMVVSLVGCDGDDAGDEEVGETMAADTTETGDALSHAVDIQPIWDAGCVTDCHEPGGTAAMVLDLSGNAYANIVDINSGQAQLLKLVEPNNSAESYLVAKLEGNQNIVGGTGLDMPSGSDPLDAATLTTIKAWIDAGAPE
jgi:hypothetical protein